MHGEAKARHGLARAARRGLENVAIQAYLTAAAINLKRLAKALLSAWLRTKRTRQARLAAIAALVTAFRDHMKPPARTTA